MHLLMRPPSYPVLRFLLVALLVVWIGAGVAACGSSSHRRSTVVHAAAGGSSPQTAAVAPGTSTLVVQARRSARRSRRVSSGSRWGTARSRCTRARPGRCGPGVRAADPQPRARPEPGAAARGHRPDLVADPARAAPARRHVHPDGALPAGRAGARAGDRRALDPRDQLRGRQHGRSRNRGAGAAGRHRASVDRRVRARQRARALPIVCVVPLPDGQRINGRPADWSFGDLVQDFANISRALPSTVTLAGPAMGSSTWIPLIGQFLAGNPRLGLVTLHRYPLKHCSAEYPGDDPGAAVQRRIDRPRGNRRARRRDRPRARRFRCGSARWARSRAAACRASATRSPRRCGR